MKNKYRIEGNIVYIKLRRKDGVILETMIDLEDFDKVNNYDINWYATYDKHIEGYYCHGKVLDNNKRITLCLHRVIMNLNITNLQVDHIYHNTLDNRKSELRIVTCQENRFNNKDAKGYYWSKKDNKWHSRIHINDKKISLGYFNNEEDARKIYLEAKEIYHTFGEENKKSNNEITEFINKINSMKKNYKNIIKNNI